MNILHLVWRLLPLVLMLGIVSWVIYFWFKRSDARAVLAIKLVGTALIMAVLFASALSGSPFVIIVALLGSVPIVLFWAPSLCNSIGEQFGKLYTGGNAPPDPMPLYSIAQARIKQGRYTEAIAELHKQLAQFPTDFVGQMMLADLYAETLHDLDQAESIVNDLLTQEGHAPMNMAFALNRLADWHLKFRQDPVSAQQALERICQLLPGTEHAQLASQRIAHLSTRDHLLARRDPRLIPIVQGDPKLGLRTDCSALKPAPPSVQSQAQEFIERLRQFPDDNQTREDLALLYAREYQRLDLALEQLEQLIAAPNQLPKHVVHWLNLMADLQMQSGGDLNAARVTLQRIMDLYPKTAAAEMARTRTAYLKLEIKTKAPTTVKMGTYQRDIGLKGPPAR